MAGKIYLLIVASFIAFFGFMLSKRFIEYAMTERIATQYCARFEDRVLHETCLYEIKKMVTWESMHENTKN